jgi:hypothetical protein
MLGLDHLVRRTDRQPGPYIFVGNSKRSTENAGAVAVQYVAFPEDPPFVLLLKKVIATVV